MLERLRKVNASNAPSTPGRRSRQGRLDSFFGLKPHTSIGASSSKDESPAKRPRFEPPRQIGSQCSKAADLKLCDDLAEVQQPQDCVVRPLSQAVFSVTANVGLPWSCSACTFRNDPQLPYCEMCESPGPSEANVYKDVSHSVAIGAPSNFPCLSQSHGEQSCVIDLDD